MKSATNILLAALVPCLFAVLAWQHFHQNAPVSVAASELQPFDTCYDETAATQIAGYAEDGSGMPQSWHRQMVAFLTTKPDSPGDLPADILALPDLTGLTTTPTLRVAMAHDRDSGTGKLFRAVQQLHKRNFDSLFGANSGAREEVRNILFLWMGVDGVDPASRGPFIDAQELAFMEKLMGEKFYQIGRYPNPAPISATFMKLAFKIMLDHSYSEIMLQGAGRDFFLSPAAFAKEGRFLSYDAMKKVSADAASLRLPEDRLAYWRGILTAISPEMLMKLKRADLDLLDAAIRSSAPETNLQNVMNLLMAPPEDQVSLIQQHKILDRLGRPLRFQISYSNRMNYRAICYSYYK